MMGVLVTNETKDLPSKMVLDKGTRFFCNRKRKKTWKSPKTFFSSKYVIFGRLVTLAF